MSEEIKNEQTQTEVTTEQPISPTEAILNCYPRVPSNPMIDGGNGFFFDFNSGARVQLPKEGGPWVVRIANRDNDITIFSETIDNNMIVTISKKYYINYHIEVFKKEEIDKYEELLNANPLIANDVSQQPKKYFEHDYDCENKTVLLMMNMGTIGDTMCWIPYVERFREIRKCNLYLYMLPHLAEIVRKQYPEINFITDPKTLEGVKPYATYYVGLFFNGNRDFQPCDHKFVGLNRTLGFILGVDTPEELKPRFDLSAERKIKEPYVCIATKATTHAKHWNNPRGWYDVIKFLKEAGYRVLCIDKDPITSYGNTVHEIPNGCEDFTGNIPLQERINLIKDADFFVGLASGLSWLAWGCNVPIVMISGFSHPYTEFYTPYRVINWDVCNSCWNDMKVDFDHHDYMWCPYHKGTAREYECTKFISPKMVIDKIKQIPAYQEQIKKNS